MKTLQNYENVKAAIKLVPNYATKNIKQTRTPLSRRKFVLDVLRTDTNASVEKIVNLLNSTIAS